ncbi:Het-C domain-containing protein [Pseudomonas donghuensis]|uniref:Het-C domain-containing protein n=1 Tax=Pseudomonas donghuensis TaxID=1163398 RepID=UPI0020C4B335|nr:Het-C domain-containing protein [Pseudomonas donghuensis]MCP6691531.1 Het-C domain-containing protein [Pseudomonas donghuensis]
MTSSPATLTTTFALDRLTEIAESLSPQALRSMLAPVFGDDLPETCYQRLHDALRDGALASPDHQIGPQALGKASYDNATRIIHLHPEVIENALRQPQAACELATILLHEFGHHLDNVLRQDFAPRLADGRASVAEDAQGEEGVRFAYLFCNVAPLEPGKLTVARLCAGVRDTHLQVDHPALRRFIRLSQGEDAQRADSHNARHEGFSAGGGDKRHPERSWGHGSIEEDLKYAGFNEQQRKAIYFGNWLRDYSQLLDPKLVRAPDAPKDFPAKFSREVLTQLVDLLALKTFPSLQGTPQERSHYVVTPQMLGVYRPSEHIDNPYNPSASTFDPRTIDPDFEAPVAHDDPLLQVDPKTSMKRHIFTSVDYMCERLRDAMATGPTPKGLREFGAALHVLEDYFAHSNYAELSLRKQGHKAVLPWTGKTDCRHAWPVVTGMFAGTDVIASLAEPMAKVLFKTSGSFESITPGQRADSELALLILLRDHPDPKWQAYLQTSLEVRDALADIPGFNGLRRVSWISSSPIRHTQDLMKMGYQAVLNLIGNTVDDLQTLRKDNPNTSGSTNPTHSQLAKDHDVHPLHTLASLMARVAVRNVGLAMYKHWEGGRLLDPVKVARSYFTHPNDSDWQDELVSVWASEHSAEIKRAGKASVFDTPHGHEHPDIDTSVWERIRGLFR